MLTPANTNGTKRLIPKSREEWLGMRKGRMTSSLTAGALGLDRHSSPLKAWLAITGRDDFDGNRATLRGTLLESPVLDYPTRGGHFKRETAPFVLHGNGWSADSTDCLYRGGNNTLVLGEGKTVSQTMVGAWGDENSDEIPQHTLVQCMWHLAHWPEAVGVLLPVLVGGYTFEFREYYVDRDDNIIGEIMEGAERFHRDYVLTDMPPPPGAGDAGLLHYFWPRHVSDKWLAPTAELESYTREYIEARDVERAAEAIKEDMRAKIAGVLQDAEGSQGDGWKVTYKYQGGGKPRTDWEGMAKYLGATDAHVQQFTSIAPGYRVLRATLPAPKTSKKGKAA